MARTSAAWLALLLVVACGDDDGGADAAVDAAPRQDGAVILDASFNDAASDAGPASDAGAIDAGEDLACGGPCDPAGGRCGDGLCVLTGSAPACSLGAGLGALGDPCEVTTECTAGLACFRRREGGVCGRVCCAASPRETCGEDEHCGGTGVLVDGTITRYRECLAPRTCDVLRDDNPACFSGEACFIVGERETDCRVPGEVRVGGACAHPEDCQAGLSCVGLFEGTCVRVCSLRDESCPASEGMCVAYAQSPPGTGLCTLPMM